MSDSPGGSRSSDGFAARWMICASAYKPVRRGGEAATTDHSPCDVPHAAAIDCEQTLRRADSVQSGLGSFPPPERTERRRRRGLRVASNRKSGCLPETGSQPASRATSGSLSEWCCRVDGRSDVALLL